MKRYYSPLRKGIDRLTEKEKTIIIERYFKNKTLEEVGKLFQVTRERIRHLEAKAERKMLWFIKNTSKSGTKATGGTGAE